jgi:hypothetical protein
VTILRDDDVFDAQMPHTFDVVLEHNSDKKVGFVWCHKDLWEGYSIAFNAQCGPFGTRIDAEAEVVDMWVRSHNMPYWR